jgi:S-(hydroxymethyl)glutathione dehydrogenase / alcohol dehydrogenase
VRAAVCREFGKPLVIETIEVLPPGPGEIKVRVVACAICHSDIFYAEGAWGGRLPAVYGHEASGVIEEVGSGVDGLRPGDHVVVTLIRSCGHCHYCAQGAPVTCEARFPLDDAGPLRASDGSGIVQGLRTGAFAEYVVVDASQAVVIPDEVPFESASLLACGVITGFGAVVNTANMRPGANAVVIGAGGVGLNAIQAAAHCGARTIVAMDIVESKLAVARRFGATHALNPVSVDAKEAVRDVTDGRGADFVFVTVGARAAFDQSLQLLSRAGTLVLVGMPASGVMTEIDPGHIANENHRILGSKMGSARIAVDIPYLVSLYRQGRLKLDELITGRYPLERINEAIASANSGEALRNVIVV